MRRQKCQKTLKWRQWANCVLGKAVQFEFYVNYRKKFAHQILKGYIFKKSNNLDLKFNPHGYKAVYNIFLLSGVVHALNKVKVSSVKELKESESGELIAQWMIHKLELENEIEHEKRVRLEAI